jgi:hypothetical protein
MFLKNSRFGAYLPRCLRISEIGIYGPHIAASALCKSKILRDPPKVSDPTVARLPHLAVARPTGVPGRAARLEQTAGTAKNCVSEAVLLEQMTRARNGGLVRHHLLAQFHLHKSVPLVRDSCTGTYTA